MTTKESNTSILPKKTIYKKKNSLLSSKKYRIWKDHEEESLKTLYNEGLDIFKISELIHRTPSAIATRLTNLKVIEHYYMARGYDKIIHKDNLNSTEQFQSIIIELQEIRKIIENKPKTI